MTTDLNQLHRDATIATARELHAEIDPRLYGKTPETLRNEHAKMHHVLGRVLAVIDDERQLLAERRQRATEVLGALGVE
ncbi:MAG: hypothetical protein GEV07_03095 [Streptosporangiales bacterium]|nr:hypothetical protein [Streptosporangiales bacterium]